MKILIKKIIKEEIKRLNEITTKDAYDKFYKDIPQQQFDKIISADPFTKPNFLSPYAKWLLNIYKKKNLRLEDLEAATEYIQTYNRYKDKYKNVNWTKLNTLADLYNVIKDDIAYSQAKTGNVNLCQPIDGSEKVYEGQEWCIIVPETEYTACYYGRNTEWCTAWGEMSFDDRHKGKTNRFESHRRQGQLYIIINKTNQNEKYQFHFESSQFMDVKDNQIDINDFFNDNDDIYQFFSNEIDNLEFKLCEKALENGNTEQYDSFWKSNFTDIEKRSLLVAAFEGDSNSDGYYTVSHVLNDLSYNGMEEDFKIDFLNAFENSIENSYDDENYDAKMFLEYLGGINEKNYSKIFGQLNFQEYNVIEKIFEIVQDFEGGSYLLNKYIKEKDIELNQDLLDTLDFLKTKFYFHKNMFSSKLANVKIKKITDFQKGLVNITFTPKNEEGKEIYNKSVSGVVNYKNIIKYLTIPQIPLNESIKKLIKEQINLITELGENDVNVKYIMNLYDKSDDTTKKIISYVITRKEVRPREKILNELRESDYNEIQTFLKEIKEALKLNENFVLKLIKEEIKRLNENKIITCKKCGHQWYLKDGGDDPYTCHKCNPKTLNEKCWKGYTQKGMKTMFGKQYPNCVKKKK